MHIGTCCPQPRRLGRNGKRCTPTPNFWSARQTRQFKFSSRSYGQDFPPGFKERIDGDQFLFPLDSDLLDPCLGSDDLVLTVEVDGSATAYLLDRIGDAAVNDQVGGRPVVVVSKENGRAVGAFFREVDARSLTFDYRADRETESVWDGEGRATECPLAGKELERSNTRRAFWFSIAITLPGVHIHLVTIQGQNPRRVTHRCANVYQNDNRNSS